MTLMAVHILPWLQNSRQLTCSEATSLLYILGNFYCDIAMRTWNTYLLVRVIIFILRRFPMAQ